MHSQHILTLLYLLNRCLVENGWNYEKAAEVFTTLNSQGKIPPEAFLRTWKNLKKKKNLEVAPFWG